jgi:hypothetical protein
MASSPKLLDQVTIVARLKHLSLRTEKAYRQHIKQFILFHNKRHPIEMGETEIRVQFFSLFFLARLAQRADPRSHTK